ncbi:MAG: hypothetical protein JWM19_4437 [Actinomycetia bacterium]|nr:hypothetical protein [Actinomycetes bacterium]
MTPAWILDILAALMLAVAAVSAARLCLARPWQKGAAVTDTAVSHLFMGIAMASMLASGLTTLPNAAWDVIFAVLAAWFGYRVVQDARSNGVRALAGGHCAPHLVHSAAMLYMFLALAAPAPGGPGMGGMGGASAMQALKYPTLAFVFALILIGYTIWDLDQLSGKRYSRAGASLSLAGVPTASVPALAGTEPGAPASGTVMPGDAVVSGGSPQTAWTGAAPAETTGAEAAPAGAAAWLLSAGTTVGCRIAMGATMAFMLLITI